jgi:hypothetical protein
MRDSHLWIGRPSECFVILFNEKRDRFELGSACPGELSMRETCEIKFRLKLEKGGVRRKDKRI